MTSLSLSLNPSFHLKQSNTRPRRPISRSRAPLPCRSHADPSHGGGEQQTKPEKKEDNKEEKKEKRRWSLVSLFGEAEKLRRNLSPKEKGDWKDLFLMSFAFAVYIYIAQQIVCAYCAWMFML